MSATHHPHHLRRFPYAGWAWPQGSRNLLLQAALLPDATHAQAALRAWLASHDLNDMGFHDHRLLAAISERHGRDLSQWPEAPRLKGLQRQLWTQSRMRIHAILPILQALKDAHIDIMLLKGAARIALRPEAQRQRAHQDVDILVPEHQMQRAAQVLSEAGWQTARGDSAMAAVARAPGARAINFQKLPWGDIDLHRNAWHGSHLIESLDASLWSRSVQTDYFGIPVCVPAAAERLALALSHGAWSPDAHSDWLVDAADILAHDEIDWPQFQHIVQQRKIQSQVRVGLSYLHHVIGLTLPADITASLNSSCQWPTLLIAKAPAELNAVQRTLRQVCHVYQRRQRHEANRPDTPPLKLSLAKACRFSDEMPEMQTSAAISPQEELKPGLYRVKTKVVLPTPTSSRRIELELQGQGEHLARFRVYARPSVTGFIEAQLCATIRIQQATHQLRLEMRPSKLLAERVSTKESQRYAAMPFALMAHSTHVSAQR